MAFKKKKWSKKALKLLGLAANGVPEAQYELAILLLDGTGVPKNDTLALDWLLKSSLLDNEDANYMLYHFYKDGRIVPPNYKIALGFLVKAAEGTNKYAQFELADYHMSQYNKAEAFEWYKKAARQEYAPAQYEVGLCFYHGNGTFQSNQLAKEWLEKAAGRNYTQAEDLLENLDFSQNT